MSKRIKLILLSIICFLSMSIGMFLLLTPSLYTSDAKTLNTTVYLFGQNGLYWKNATVYTFTKTSDNYTYTLYGGNASYNVKQGTDGGDPDFDWGHAYINSSSSTNSHSTSGSATSWNKNAINCYIENFNSSYYTVYANVYHNGSHVKTINNFDSYANANYDSGKEAQYRAGTSGDSKFEVDYYVSPKTVTGYLYYKYGSTNSYITSISSRYGVQVTLPSISPKTGYHFQEWRNSSGNKLSTRQNSANVVMYSLNPYFYAYCPANTYYVRYNKNSSSATGSMSNSTFTYAQSGSLSQNAFTRYGYSFAGWATSASGSVVYSNRQSIYNLTSTNNAIIDLYAVWTPNPYTLTANANGGTIPPTSYWSGSGVSATKSVYFDNSYGSLPTPTKTGYSFKGWFTSSSGGSEVSSDTKMTKTGATIYAHWQANTYPVTLKKEGGEGGSSSFSVTYDDYLESKLDPPERTGYDFVGYYDNSGNQYYNSGGQLNSQYNKRWQVETGLELIAHWSPITYTITFNTNGGYDLPPVNYNIEQSFTLPIPTRLGYDFDKEKSTGGWRVKVDSGNWGVGTKYYTDINLTNMYGDVELTVERWIPLLWTLTFNPNGGSVTPTSRQVMIDTAYGELPIPSKKGCIFKGWYTLEDGGDIVTSQTKMTTEDATIYAQWEETWAVKTTVTELKTDNDIYDFGTENNPYLITNAEELAYIAKLVEGGNSLDNVYFRQEKNIDLKKDINNNVVNYIWLPIGSSATSFNGNYNGQGYVIENMILSKTRDSSTGKLRNNQGLFGVAMNAELTKINLISGEIYGEENVGGLVGYMIGGSISNCLNGISINNSSTGRNIGGIIGLAENVRITTCYNYGNITSLSNAGGIAGFAQSIASDLLTIIENCYSRCNVISGSSAGGIVGQCTFYTRISACGFNGNVIASSNKGSIVGYSDSSNGKIENCFAIITGTDDLEWRNGSGSVENCISKLSDDTNKKYIGTDFTNWSIQFNGQILANGQADGQPMPAGFSWIGTSGDRINEEIIKRLGYVK